MNAKKLDQSVFEGLPKEYRWAAVDANAKAWAFIKKPVCDDLMFCDGDDAKSENVGVFFDTTDWQNSLIERQDVPTADIDWSRQEVPAGATHINAHGQFLRKHGQIGWMQYWGSDWIAIEFTESDIAAFREIPKLEPQVDWSKAPEGATHYSTYSHQWFAVYDDGTVMGFDRGMWHKLRGNVFDLESAKETIKRPESIHDIARSIEAARVAEKSMPYPDGDARYFETSDVPETKKYPHYFKDVSAVDAIDLYHVARLYDITDPALFHAFKKIACAGKRGAKDQAQDVQEAIDALKRWQELNV